MPEASIEAFNITAFHRVVWLNKCRLSAHSLDPGSDKGISPIAGLARSQSHSRSKALQFDQIHSSPKHPTACATRQLQVAQTMLTKALKNKTNNRQVHEGTDTKRAFKGPLLSSFQNLVGIAASVKLGSDRSFAAVSTNVSVADKTVTHNFGKTVGLRLDPFVLLYAHTGASTVYRRSPSIRAYGKPCRFLTVQSPASELSMSNDLRHNTPK